MRSRLVLVEQQALPAITLSAEMAVREIAAVLALRRLVLVRCCYVLMVAVVVLVLVLLVTVVVVVVAHWLWVVTLRLQLVLLVADR